MGRIDRWTEQEERGEEAAAAAAGALRFGLRQARSIRRFISRIVCSACSRKYASGLEVVRKEMCNQPLNDLHCPSTSPLPTPLLHPPRLASAVARRAL